MQKGSNNKFYFLGFAFHKENSKLIHLKNLKFGQINKPDPYFHYTNYKNSKKIEEFLNRQGFRENMGKRFSSEKGVYDALMHDFDLNF